MTDPEPSDPPSPDETQESAPVPAPVPEPAGSPGATPPPAPSAGGAAEPTLASPDPASDTRPAAPPGDETWMSGLEDDLALPAAGLDDTQAIGRDPGLSTQAIIEEIESRERTQRRHRGIRIALLTGGIAVLLSGGWLLGSILNPLLVAFLIAYILNPVVDFFERRGVDRIWSILGLYAVLFVLIAGVTLIVFPLAGSEISYLVHRTVSGEEFKDLNANGVRESGVEEPYTDMNGNGVRDPEEPFNDLDENGAFAKFNEAFTDENGNGEYDPSYLDRVRFWVEDQIAKWNQAHPKARIETSSLFDQIRRTVRERGDEVASTGSSVLAAVTDTLLSSLRGFFAVVSYLILVPFYIFFFLLGMHALKDRIVEHLPGAYRNRWMATAASIHDALALFFRGQLLICFLKGSLLFFLLSLLDIRFALLFALVHIVLCLVPYLGLVVGILVAGTFVIIDSGAAMSPMLKVVLSYAIVEMIDGLLLYPFIMGRQLGLHPVILVLSILVASQIFGFFGLLVAVPLAVTGKILFLDYVRPELVAMAKEKPPPR